MINVDIFHNFSIIYKGIVQKALNNLVILHCGVCRSLWVKGKKHKQCMKTPHPISKLVLSDIQCVYSGFKSPEVSTVGLDSPESESHLVY